jgi:hypothetical protein
VVTGTNPQATSAYVRLLAARPITGTPQFEVSEDRGAVRWEGSATRDLTRDYIGGLLSGLQVQFTLSGDVAVSGGWLAALRGAAETAVVPTAVREGVAAVVPDDTQSTLKSGVNTVTNAVAAPFRAVRNGVADIANAASGAIESTPTKILTSVGIVVLAGLLILLGAGLALYLTRGLWAAAAGLSVGG